MKRLIYTTFILAGCILLNNCSTPDDDVDADLALNQADKITRFRVYKNINEFYDATISHDDTTIVLSLPANMGLDKLQPEVIVSENAKVSPSSGAIQSFITPPVIYKVVAQDGTHIREYKVTVNNNLN